MLRLLSRRLMRSKAFVAYCGAFLGVALASCVGLASTTMAVFANAAPGVGDETSLLRLAAPRTNTPFPVWSMSFSLPEVHVVQDAAKGSVGSVAGYGPLAIALATPTATRGLTAEAVTSNYFAVLGARRVAGSLEWRPGEQHGVVISEALAHTLGRSAADMPGRQVRLNGDLWLVQGVAGFSGLEEDPTEVFLPIDDLGRLGVAAAWVGSESRWLRVLVRLAPRTTPDMARKALLSALSGEPLDFAVQRVTLEPLNLARGLERSRREVVLLVASATAMALLVLLIANLAQLFLLRWLQRAHEFAVHGALGATSRQLALLSSSEPLAALSLGAVGGALGGQLLSRSAPALALRARSAELELNGHWAGAVLITIVAILGVALAPVLVTTLRQPAFAVLRHGRADSSRVDRLLAWMLGFQVFVTTGAIITTSVSSDSLARIADAPLGFDADHLYAVAPILTMARPQYGAVAQLAEHLRSSTGVTSLSLTATVPTRTLTMTRLYLRGTQGRTEDIDAELYRVDAAFFLTTGLSLERGRDEVLGTWRPNGNVAVLSVSADSIRKSLGDNSSCIQVGGPNAPCLTVVGTVNEARFRGSMGAAGRAVYLPYDTITSAQAAILVRSFLPPADAILQLRKVATSAQDERAPVEVHWIQGSLEAISAPWRAGVRLMQIFCTIAVVIAVVGVTSVSLRTVGSRRREIGVMMALGASNYRIVSSMLGRAVLNSLLALTAACACGLLGLRHFARVLMLAPDSNMRSVLFAAIVAAMSVAVGLALPFFSILQIQPTECMQDTH